MQAKQHILVVDERDKKFSCLDLGLEENSYEIMHASSKEQTLQLIRQHEFSLIVIHLKTPEIKEISAFQQIQREEKDRLTPILFAITPEYHIKLMESVQESATIDYLFFPIDPKLVRHKIEKLLHPDHSRKKPFHAGQHHLKENLPAADNDRIESLIQKINEKQAEVKEMADQNRAIQIEKYNFINTISHESRTYMNGIIGMSGLLLDTRITDEQKDYARTICDSAQSLLNIINDIVILSKIETDQMDIEIIDFDLRSEINQVFKIIKLISEEKGLEFSNKIDPNIASRFRGDPEKIKQILMNLAENAVKFTNKGRVTISLNLKSDSEDASLIYFEIRDTGVGIPNHKLITIFDSSKKEVNLLSTRYGRTKLGLSISKALINLMGGEIGAESVLNEGSIFWFTLSIDKHPTNYAGEELQSIPKLKHKRILIIENHSTFQKLLSGYLSSLKCFFKIKTDERSALRELMDASHNQKPYDIVIFSAFSIGFDAEEMGASIKSKEALKDIKLLMLGSSGNESDLQRLFNKGFSAYMEAPIRKIDLFDTLIEISENRLPIADQLAAGSSSGEWIAKVKKNALQRILVVEDNQISQKFIKNLLDKMGYDNHIVENGIYALEALRSPLYHLVLMDLLMPELDGYETTRAIRDLSSPVANHHVPIIALTASTLPEERSRCLNFGMNDYLTKPINPEKLFEKLEFWLSKPMNIEEGNA